MKILPHFLLLPFLAASDRTPLETYNLEAVHVQRVEWMKRRVVLAPTGIYQDFRAALDPPAAGDQQVLRAAKNADARVVASSRTEMREGVLFLNVNGSSLRVPQFPQEDPEPFLAMTPRERRRIESQFKQFPDEVFAFAGPAALGARGDHEIGVALLHAAFRNTSTHILARELSEPEIRASLAAGRLYTARDWLCDPAGFFFVAQNLLGAFDIGDAVPMFGDTSLYARLPVRAKIKLMRNGATVAEANDSKVSFIAREEGDYRLAAWLTVAGQDRPWIYSNPIHVRKQADLAPPPRAAPPSVEARRDIPYTEGASEDAVNQQLDLYLPRDKKNFPVMMFLHGGSGRWSDRDQYPALGNRFATNGIGVVIPSYRPVPHDRHPAQIEDAAAAFAWVYRNIAQYGGDATRIYVAGHSAGGRLAALLALHREYLSRNGIPADAIRGVAAMSGVYDVSPLAAFRPERGRPDSSALHYVDAQAPPFLVTYCQWDYPGLPKQARDFETALRKAFVAAKLVYVPGQSHMSEILNIWKDDDPLAGAVLDFVK